MSTAREILGNNIRAIREANGWNQAKLAVKIGITPTFLMHIERGTRGVSLDTIDLIASAFCVSISRLFEHNPEEDCPLTMKLPPEMELEIELKKSIYTSVLKYIDEMKKL